MQAGVFLFSAMRCWARARSHDAEFNHSFAKSSVLDMICWYKLFWHDLFIAPRKDLCFYVSTPFWIPRGAFGMNKKPVGTRKGSTRPADSPPPPACGKRSSITFRTQYFERNISSRPPKTYESILQTSTAQQVFAQFQANNLWSSRQRTTYRNEPQRKISLRISDLARTESFGI